ncbi:Spermatogenesis-associated protein 24-like [Oopsacas minuta]|uniref:Spermatogenesis-associated protein 24-like n=1 Tax=Oopsacas minuta TaxID=111878 RepID=A0AAV7JDF6_9METZ|nr:Spermatogenesis-associated protein 24-like [Oopsacas minuta]
MSDHLLPSHYTVSKQIVDCILLQDQLVKDLITHKQRRDTTLPPSPPQSVVSVQSSVTDGFLEIQNLEAQLECLKQEKEILGEKLEAETERAERSTAESEILSKQLEREKETFENAFGLMRTRALQENSKNEDLSTRCAALEAMLTKKDQELASKDEKIRELNGQLKKHKEAHKHLLSDMSLKMQQELFIDKMVATGTSKKQKK